MRATIVFLAGLTLFPLSSVANPPSANEVLAPVKAKAAGEKKAIFVHFSASWCGYCKKLDAFLERPDIKPVFEKYFVPVKLVVQEKNKNLENSGAEALVKKLGGPAGLPYSAFLDSGGGMIINSKRSGENIGYPTQPQEIDWFMQMMKKAAPNISPEDLKVIETALRNPKKT
jgi:thiol-disulfide isomerase/thioredoxin